MNLYRGIEEATTADLTSISGVGSALARRIIRFREEQGAIGERLQEVSGVGDSLAAKIYQFFADNNSEDGDESREERAEVIAQFHRVAQAYLEVLAYWWESGGDVTVGIEPKISDKGIGEYFRENDITEHSADSPLTAIARFVHLGRELGVNIMQIDITSIVAVSLIEVGEEARPIQITEDESIANILRDTLLSYAQKQAPQGAENPIVVISGMPVPGRYGTPVPMRVAIGRGHMIERGQIISQQTGSRRQTSRPIIGIRINYVVSPATVFSGVPEQIVEELLSGAMDHKRILFVGPSGSGKTTVMQALFKLIADSNPLFKVFIVGRFVEPLTMEKPYTMIGLPEDDAVAALPLSVQMTQKQFGTGLSSLEILTAQGPTRLSPDIICVDEVLTRADMNIAALAVTAGVGTWGTIHGRGTDPNAYVDRLRAISVDLPIKPETFADIIVGVDKRRVVRIDGDVEWKREA